MEVFKLKVYLKTSGNQPAKVFPRVTALNVAEGELSLHLATGVPVRYKKGHWETFHISPCDKET